MAFIAVMGIIALFSIIAIIWMEYDSHHMEQTE